MIIRTLNTIAIMCEGELLTPEATDIKIKGVVTDSRKITPDCLFIPLSGENFEGHQFGAAALAAGAAGLLWQRDKGPAPEGAVIAVEDTLRALQLLSSAYLNQIGPQVVAITGSNGKTTTKDIVTSLLETQFKVHKTQGNFNNHIGLPLTLLSMNEDTEIAVLEMGMSSRGEIALLTALGNPDIAVITNVGESHLLQLGSRKEIARAKLEITGGLKAGGLLVYNGDEPLLAEVLAEGSLSAPKEMKTFRFGLNADNDDYPTGIMTHVGGMTFTSHCHGDHAFTLPLPGRHNVINSLAALAVARHFGVNEENIEAGLRNLKLTGMRIEVITTPSGFTLLNDAYNASPTSMKAAIDVLQTMKGSGMKIAVLGDMLELGPDETKFHEEIGSYLDPDKTDLIFTYGRLSEHLAQAAEKNFGSERVFSFTDKTELTNLLITKSNPKDILLFKASRGMRMEEVLQSLIAHD
ncbi:UDP-N-acetylmuramoyl-tripeptide--D-alanyl-D-alanine ligase [Paenibacillus wynnii]|uniref:UDP-N-acetylmuramoyl-tripeptide--D-alanyl-D-alanine ligase n=1 Tax=Paenibacillus wynnii TaxID=268407 RepID=A0A098M9A4_9BACL|nr:UDP-N-acetylmuramoyl-tripeptide--D-alanyl-D-alanine ligase [Paenibacillus wynnii]KGE18112.1 UDP-N-acetylmuramoyl-tripeptide--D-alanyl-D-alanine ligase [Paenibacillus wynnii]